MKNLSEAGETRWLACSGLPKAGLWVEEMGRKGADFARVIDRGRDKAATWVPCKLHRLLVVLRGHTARTWQTVRTKEELA